MACRRYLFFVGLDSTFDPRVAVNVDKSKKFLLSKTIHTSQSYTSVVQTCRELTIFRIFKTKNLIFRNTRLRMVTVSSLLVVESTLRAVGSPECASTPMFIIRNENKRGEMYNITTGPLKIGVTTRVHCAWSHFRHFSFPAPCFPPIFNIVRKKTHTHICCDQLLCIIFKSFLYSRLIR